MDFAEAEPAVESIDWMATLRYGGASNPTGNGTGRAWPWGQPYTPYTTPNFFNPGTFAAKTSTTSWAYPGPNRIFFWPQVIGRTRSVTGLAITRRSASASSDDNRIALAIYDSSLTRLWDVVGYLYPATAALVAGGVGAAQTDVGNISFFHVSPALTLTAGRLYWFAMMYPQALVTNNVAINAFHASLLFPLHGVGFMHDLAGATTAHTITPAAPQPIFANGYAFFDGSANAIAVPNPWRLPKAINVATGLGGIGMQFDTAQTITSQPSGATIQSAFVPYPTNVGIPGYNDTRDGGGNPIYGPDPGVRDVAQSTGNGGANVPAIWTSLS